MKIQCSLFNIYLPLAILSLAGGCKTSEERQRAREVSTIRLHLETSLSANDRSGTISVPRQNPMLIRMERDPILDEGNLLNATVVEELGGFAIQLKFDGHGSLVLNSATTANRGKRLVVFSHFGTSRWLAAPRITGPIMNGVFTFTPDASREEADRIVRGLNNVVKKLTSKFPY